MINFNDVYNLSSPEWKRKLPSRLDNKSPFMKTKEKKGQKTNKRK